jgi:hypothetical protein
MSWWQELLKGYQDKVNDPFATEIVTNAYAPSRSNTPRIPPYARTRNPLTSFLFGSANPTILSSDDPRVRDEVQRKRAAELRGRPPSLSDVFIPGKEERFTKRMASEYGSDVISDFSGRESVFAPNVVSSQTRSGMGGGKDRMEIGVNKETPLPDIRPTEEQEKIKPELKEIYGKFSRDPEARKKEYINQLNKIYTNAMILNAMAQLTGGQSQANAYIRMATSKMDAIAKYDEESRLQQIWKNVFFFGGEFNRPTDYQEAYDRAIKLGATPKEAQEIASSAYAKPSSTGSRIGATEQAQISSIARSGFGNTQYTQEQLKEIREIISKPNGIYDLQERYPELVDEYIRKKNERSNNISASLAAITALGGTTTGTRLPSSTTPQASVVGAE